MSHVPGQTYNCCLQFNNIATIIFRQDVRYFATERDDGRYVTVLKRNETTIGRYVFIVATAQDGIYCKSTRRRSVLSREKTAQVFKYKVFRQMWREHL